MSLSPEMLHILLWITYCFTKSVVDTANLLFEGKNQYQSNIVPALESSFSQSDKYTDTQLLSLFLIIFSR